MGENEKDIPAWIQDHISNAENYITQASFGYYEYENESKVVKENAPCWKGYKQVGMKDKSGKQVPNCVPEEVEYDVEELFDKMGFDKAQRKEYEWKMLVLWMFERRYDSWNKFFCCS